MLFLDAVVVVGGAFLFPCRGVLSGRVLPLFGMETGLYRILEQCPTRSGIGAFPDHQAATLVDSWM
jgi:hypothetical protein